MRNTDERTRTYGTPAGSRKGTGPNSAGQSGDTQGLSETEEAGSESVTELLEEGNSFEAEVIQGVEDAPDADTGDLRTKEVPEDDVAPEYRSRDEDVQKR